MNQIYACRKGREIPFNGTTRIDTTSPATRSDGRNLFVKLLMGVFVFLVFGAVQTSAQTSVFTTSGTYTVPLGITQIRIDLTGGGGAGAGSIGGSGAAGGGGGGGSFGRYICNVTPGQTITVTVGAGGVPVVGAAGGNGQSTSVSGPCNFSQPGGAGGQINTGGLGAGAGAGGTINNGGGDGGDGQVVAAGVGATGGGGGGGATFISPGVNGQLGAAGGLGGAVGGGNGGGAGNNGFAGTANTGGGGGGAGVHAVAGNDRFGGAGSAGRVEISPLVAGVPACFSPQSAGTYPAVCTTSPSFCLVGTPSGGVFTSTTAPLAVTADATCANAPNATGYRFNPAIAGPGCHNITYTYVDPNPGAPCSFVVQTTVLVFPAAVTLNDPADVCATGLTLTPQTAVAGFTQEYSFDGGTTWQTSPTGPTTPGCYTMTSRYVVQAAGFCGAAGGTTSPCANSTSVQSVVFPATPSIANMTNTCNAALTLSQIANVNGFNRMYEVVTPAGAGGGTWLTAAAAQTALNAATPGCWTVRGRYELAAVCGGTGAGATGTGACAPSANSNGVVFPATPAITNMTNTCNAPLTLSQIAPVAGFNSMYEVINPAGAGGGTWLTAANAQTALNAATPGCWTVRGRYELAAPCGTAAAAGATGTGACAPSANSNGVVFPATPTIAQMTNTCVTALTLQQIAPVAGFNSTYEVINPAGGGAGTWLTAANAQTALNAATPGCWTVRGRYELAAPCGTAAAAGATGTGACAPSANSNGVVFPQPVAPTIPSTCSPTPFTPTMPVVAGFNQQFSNDAGATWYSGPSPVSNSGCYSVIGRYTLAAACGGTAAGNAGPCANSPATNTVIYPLAPVISAPVTTCTPNQFVLPSVPDQSPNFITQWSIAGAPFAFNPVLPTAPGIYSVQARYVTAAVCGTIPALTPGPACSQTNVVNAQINSVPSVTQAANQTVCCNTVVPATTLTTTAAQVPGGGTVTFNWTNSDPSIGLAAAGTGNVPSFTAVCAATTKVATINVTATHTNGGTSCTGPVMTYTITVRAQLTGVIELPANQTICAGQNGSVNVTLTGTPQFNGVFNILNNTTATTTTLNWNSNAVGGPQAVNIPTASIPNGTNTPITYTISWNSLTDASGCPSTTSGSTNITVNPLPNLHITRSPSTNPQCPGTVITYTVVTDPGAGGGGNNPGGAPNTVAATFNYTITRVSDNTVVQSGTNVPYGTVVFNTPTCPAVGAEDTYTFAATPFATQAPNCPGPTETNTLITDDTNNPVFNAFANQTFDRCAFAAINAALAATPTATNGGCPAGNATIVQTSRTFTPSCGYTSVAGYQNGETGTITTVWTATDPCGNATTLTHTITVNDLTAPTWNEAPGFLNRTIEYCDLTGPNGYNAANALAPTFSDGCAYPAPHAGIAPVKTTGVFAVGACPTSGSFTNTWVVTDPCGNVSVTYTQTITVVDTQGPLFTPAVVGTQTLNVGAAANCSALLPNYIATLPITANDCATPGVFPAPAAITNGPANAQGPNKIWQTPAPGITVFGPSGTIIPITITAEDGCGNQRTMSFNVQIVDQNGPNCSPRNLTSTTAGLANSRIVLDPVTGTRTIDFVSAISDIDNNTTDNCGGPITFSFPGGTFANPIPTLTYNCNTIPNGVNTTTFNQNYLVFDQYGNSSTCVASVRVDDLQAPTFTTLPGGGGTNTCPPTQFVNRDAGCVGIMPSFIAPNSPGYPNVTAADACTPVTYVQSPAAGSIIGAGAGNNVSVTITATDVHGNSNTCTFTVTFRDVTPPSFGATCPANQNNVPAGAGSCSATVNWTVPTATDNCSPINNAGPIVYSAVATGNNTNPNITGGSFIVPGSNVSAIFFVGTTTVTYTATDQAGNATTCVFTVTVTDQTNPVITNCATLSVTKNVSTGAANCTYTHSGTAWDPTATDNCLLAVTPFAYQLTGATTTVGFVNANTLAGVVFNRGTTTVTWRVTDFSGNTTTCSFNVIVTDGVNPVFNGPNAGGCVANQTAVANTAGCVWTVPAGNTQLHVNASDNCGITLFEWDISGATPVASGSQTVPFTGTVNNGTYGIPAGTVFQVGVTNVQYRIRDAQGNIVTCIFTVTVQNNVTGTIGTTATVAQNAATTSTITFTGSGSGAAAGTQQYRFFYSLNTNGGGFVAQPAVTTAVGSNTTTVAQSNAATGTFVYRLDQVQDLTTGCMSPANLNLTATITVVVGSDLTLSWSTYQSLSFPTTGSTNNFGMNVINIGATPSAGTITVNIPKTSAFTLTLPNVATLNGNPVNNAQWTLNTGNPAFWILTTSSSIPAGGSSTAGLTVTRNANVAPQTSQPMTATLVNGSGGDQTPLNNSATVQLTAQ